jgi:hypothetical protein
VRGRIEAAWAPSGLWAREVSGPTSRDNVRVVAAWHRVSGPMSRRLNHVGAVAARGYVSGPLSRNDIRAIAAWDCVNGSMSWGLNNIALGLSRADEGQHCRCQKYFFHNAPPYSPNRPGKRPGPLRQSLRGWALRNEDPGHNSEGFCGPLCSGLVDAGRGLKA